MINPRDMDNYSSVMVLVTLEGLIMGNCLEKENTKKLWMGLHLLAEGNGLKVKEKEFFQ